MKSILDPTFRYTSAVNTDLSKTFARIRREQARSAKCAAIARQRAAQEGAEDTRRVVEIMNGRRK